MPGKKKKYNARFPPARIKKIMQSDEDVGKVAAAVPVIISRALELFISSLILDASKQTKSHNAKTLSPFHIKQAIESDKQFDFLRGVVANVSQIEDDAEDDGKRPSGRKRKPSGSSTQVSADVAAGSSDEETDTDVENDPNTLNSDEESSHSDATKPSPTSRANPTESRAKQTSAATTATDQTITTDSGVNHMPSEMCSLQHHKPDDVSVSRTIPESESLTDEARTKGSYNEIPPTFPATSQIPTSFPATDQMPSEISNLSVVKPQTDSRTQSSLPLIPPFVQRPRSPLNHLSGPDSFLGNHHAAYSELTARGPSMTSHHSTVPLSSRMDGFLLPGANHPTVQSYYNNHYRYPYLSPPPAHSIPPYALPFYPDPCMPHAPWAQMSVPIPPDYPQYGSHGRRPPDEDYDV